MPHVAIDTKRFSVFKTISSEVQNFGHSVQKIVATHFDCPDPGGDLAPSDVDVTFTEMGPFDVRNLDVVVTITANHFPSRAENARERLERVANDIKNWSGWAPDLKFGFWLQMPNCVWVA